MRNLAFMMLQGLCQIHHCNITHNDINPEHILVDPIVQDLSLCRLKICGFQLAHQGTVCAVPENATPICWYKAPEWLAQCKNIDSKADVFSAGCIICEMLTGVPMFQGDSDAD